VKFRVRCVTIGTATRHHKVFIAVGSSRKPKLNAVISAAESFASLLSADASCEVVGIEVPSGVSHTPSTQAELMRGARLRAEALLELNQRESRGWSFCVGLEGGLDVVHEPAISRSASDGEVPSCRVFLESWAYVTDGQDGYFGRSCAVEVPEALAREVLDLGMELSVAIDKFAGAVGIRDAQGAWGVLSSNLISRQEAFRIAVIAAFAPFYNRKMYQQVSAASTRS
jgi:inosine/xanthosine triphosphatase